MKLKIKDKIFLAILVFGVIVFLYDKIIGDDKKEIPKEDIMEQGDSKEGNQTESGDSSISEKQEIIIGNEKIEIRLADTESTRYQGLSNIESIRQNEGMLFLHSEPGFHPYSMRQMKFNLDFIFILDNEVVDIEENISKDFSEPIIGDNAYDKVLEINAGTAKRINILIGEKITIQDSSN